MQEIAPIKNNLEAFMKTVSVPVIETTEDYARAGDIGKQVASKIKELDEKRLAMTRPLDNTKKQIMDEFRRITEPLEAFLNETKRVMLDWNRKEQARIAEERMIEEARIDKENREREEAARKEREAAEAKAKETGEEPEFVLPPAPVVAAPLPEPEQVKTQRGAIATATVKEKWTFEITDPAAIPAEYMIPDLVKIGRAVRSGGVREIPGVRIYDEGNLSLR